MKADMIDKQKLKKLVAGGETPAVISALLKHAKAKFRMDRCDPQCMKWQLFYVWSWQWWCCWWCCWWG